MEHQILHESAGARRLDLERASELLARYPDVSGKEAREILTILRDGRYLDVGIITSNPQLKPRLDAFVADHWDKFQARSGQAETIAGLIVLLLFVAWAIWASLF
ncbi:hypothetical protein LZ496_10695 [Sphingomonas sp. NSE70-1]|uniref:Uncharacterized protein n=1 Tax=Sphingomonas caseinilyticus TaxID=2908205 RepID=A0ABT0RWF2_9SPHN|nr:hypothetical protein [Sphingomonas caseinilyticus]MCL6699246.1 hypothetical protein [Sphingomonas caseinilyticus]